MVRPSNTPDRISTRAASSRCVVRRLWPGRRRSRSACRSSSLRVSRGGHPSTTTPIPAPWLSPQVERRNRDPKVLPTGFEHRGGSPSGSGLFGRLVSESCSLGIPARGSLPSPRVIDIDGRLNLATAWEAISDTVGDQSAHSAAGGRTPWSAFDDRAARLAGALDGHGVGFGSKVALFLFNGCEYPEAQYAALKVRGIPANVN